MQMKMGTHAAVVHSALVRPNPSFNDTLGVSVRNCEVDQSGCPIKDTLLKFGYRRLDYRNITRFY